MDVEKLIELTEAALAADYPRVRRAANAIARQLSDEGAKEDAAALRALIRKKGVPLRASGYMEQLPVDAKSRLPLIEQQDWPSTPIFLNHSANRTLNNFIEDAHNIDALARGGIASRLALMLSGLPGTGKSLLAGHVASQLGRPLYVVRLDSVISSLLGDTAKNVRAIFDYIPTGNAVLFLDEVDAVAKLRDDRQEMGELKRVVNTVIQGLDSLDDGSVVVAATNHPQLLDPAIWRRFPYQIEIDAPETDVRESMWAHFLFKDEETEISTLLASLSSGLTGAEIEQIAMNARRRLLLTGSTELPLDSVLEDIWDMSASEGGARRTPIRREEVDKRDLANFLQERGLKAPQIGKLLGVSRQWALKLLEGKADG